MSIVVQEENTTKNEILELRKYVNAKINQKLLLHHRMVTNYQRMMDECAVYEKELEKIRSENARYKFVGQCLMNKVVELTGCKSANSLTGSGQDDDEAAHLNLEVSRSKYIDIILTYIYLVNNHTILLSKKKNKNNKFYKSIVSNKKQKQIDNFFKPVSSDDNLFRLS